MSGKHRRHSSFSHLFCFSEDDIEAMFETADLDKDDCLSYDEFYHMIVPSKPPTTVKPSKAQFVDFYRKRTNHE